jgi:hypothetical protein
MARRVAASRADEFAAASMRMKRRAGSVRPQAGRTSNPPVNSGGAAIVTELYVASSSNENAVKRSST